MLQKEKDDDGPPKTYKTSAAPTHYDDSAPTQPVKPKSGRSLLRRLSIEKIQELRRSSTASETVDNVDDWDDEMKMKMKKKNTSPSERDMTSIVDHKMTTTPRALTEEEVRSLRTILKKELHICDDSHAEDADDLLDYAMEMIEEGQSVGCVTDEVSLSNCVQFSSIYVSYSISPTFLAIALDELNSSIQWKWRYFLVRCQIALASVCLDFSLAWQPTKSDWKEMMIHKKRIRRLHYRHSKTILQFSPLLLCRTRRTNIKLTLLVLHQAGHLSPGGQALAYRRQHQFHLRNEYMHIRNSRTVQLMLMFQLQLIMKRRCTKKKKGVRMRRWKIKEMMQLW